MTTFAKFAGAAAALAFAPALLTSTAAAQSGPDEFVIRVVLEDLANDDSRDAFDERLERAARGYCEDAYTGSDRRSLRQCERAVTSAVREEIRDNADVYDLQIAGNW